jgi:hypothetical protein
MHSALYEQRKDRDIKNREGALTLLPYFLWLLSITSYSIYGVADHTKDTPLCGNVAADIPTSAGNFICLAPARPCIC